IIREAKRLARLVRELLDASRVEQGRLLGVREPMDLVAVAREVCESWSFDHHRCSIDTAEPVEGEFDRARMMQLLENLVENAVKYSPEGGEIHIHVWREDGQANLTVSDQGIGIAPADLPTLFERFQRGSNVDDRRFAGMGLGLFICRGIVEQHGGRIWASSPGIGHGSTFHVALPLHAGDLQHA
ncbi:MAG: HAMP domain-containing histidine kinase, partial [Anaerolineae bacterium]|nr:HAMP domain-containing histidine kinase [Anaerolineae bacterium]